MRFASHAVHGGVRGIAMLWVSFVDRGRRARFRGDRGH